MSSPEKTYDESLLRHIIDQMPDVFVLKDHEGNFLLCNQTVAKLYNTTPDEMVGKHDDDFGVPKDMADHFRKSALAVMKSGNTEIVYEDTVDATTGITRHFKSIKKPIKDQMGRDQVIIMAQDITDLIKKQKTIRENEVRLRTVMSIINEGVWDWYIPTGDVFHNKEWCRQLGTLDFCDGSLDEFEQFVHPEDLETVKEKIGRLLDGSSPLYESEHRMVRKDGVVIHVQDRGIIAERDEENKPLRVMGSFKNITEEKIAEKALIEAKEKAEEANEAKSVFLSNISHEFRTPLNAILGFTGMLKMNKEENLSERQLKWIEQVESSGHHLLELVNEVLDLAIIESGRNEYHADTFKVGELIRECLALVKPLADEAGVRVTLEAQAGLYLHVDRKKLKQSLINLIENAVKYNKQNGEIAVESRARAAQEIEITIRDKGLGIPAHELDKIFEPFFRSADHISGVEGTGIGLSIVKKNIELMGGTIKVDSQKGEGTCFTITLTAIEA